MGYSMSALRAFGSERTNHGEPMRQIILEEPGRFVAAHADPPGRAQRQALVRVRRVGVCGTDAHAFEGKQPFFSYPRILGHELAVEVVEAPPNERGIAAGDRCAVEPYLSCGRCHACAVGKPNCCKKIQVMGVHVDGGMCGWMSVPVERLYKSEKLSLDQLALVETLGIGAHAVARSALRAGEEVLVVGAGPIGLAVTQFALAAGGRVQVAEPNPMRREAVGLLGVRVLESGESVGSAASGGLGGKLADVVIDATGNPKAMEQSFNYVAHGGRLVFVGLAQARISFDDPLFHRREMTVLASRNSCGDFPRIIRMIEEGQVSTDPWITHRMVLAEVPNRFPGLLSRADCVKAMVEVTDEDR